MLARIDGWWRAANYLSVGQIYLLDNPLLRSPLPRDDVKPRLLGHWGTTPGLNFLYAHLNRAIRERDQSTHLHHRTRPRRPGLVANAYLDGTYTEIYPDITQDAEGMRRLFRQFSFPGGIPSHVAPETPGSIHEGGELGYALSHAYGAAFDNPDLLVAAVVGDGEAETGALATSWHSNKFLQPGRATAWCCRSCTSTATRSPIPTVLDRIPQDELRSLMCGYGHNPYFFEVTERPTAMRRAPPVRATARRGARRHRRDQGRGRAPGRRARPRWPMIVFRTPRAGPARPTSTARRPPGSWRAHQVPLASARDTPEHLQVLADWLGSYRPEELFDDDGSLGPSSPPWRRGASCG